MSALDQASAWDQAEELAQASGPESETDQVSESAQGWSAQGQSAQGWSAQGWSAQGQTASDQELAQGQSASDQE
ncbi:hypothetical protein, partial [Arthrobacter sp. H5]|uniref:hypothetical protein n=1 Tax=Arthrobacter sp. H5 TaxID=1267973 RepID=UPI001C1E1D5D